MSNPNPRPQQLHHALTISDPRALQILLQLLNLSNPKDTPILLPPPLSGGRCSISTSVQFKTAHGYGVTTSESHVVASSKRRRTANRWFCVMSCGGDDKNKSEAQPLVSSRSETTSVLTKSKSSSRSLALRLLLDGGAAAAETAKRKGGEQQSETCVSLFGLDLAQTSNRLERKTTTTQTTTTQDLLPYVVLYYSVAGWGGVQKTGTDKQPFSGFGISPVFVESEGRRGGDDSDSDSDQPRLVSFLKNCCRRKDRSVFESPLDMAGQWFTLNEWLAVQLLVNVSRAKKQQPSSSSSSSSPVVAVVPALVPTCLLPSLYVRETLETISRLSLRRREDENALARTLSLASLHALRSLLQEDLKALKKPARASSSAGPGSTPPYIRDLLSLQYLSACLSSSSSSFSSCDETSSFSSSSASVPSSLPFNVLSSLCPSLLPLSLTSLSLSSFLSSFLGVKARQLLSERFMESLGEQAADMTARDMMSEGDDDYEGGGGKAAVTPTSKKISAAAALKAKKKKKMQKQKKKQTTTTTAAAAPEASNATTNTNSSNSADARKTMTETTDDAKKEEKCGTAALGGDSQDDEQHEDDDDDGEQDHDASLEAEAKMASGEEDKPREEDDQLGGVQPAREEDEDEDEDERGGAVEDESEAEAPWMGENSVAPLVETRGDNPLRIDSVAPPESIDMNVFDVISTAHEGGGGGGASTSPTTGSTLRGPLKQRNSRRRTRSLFVNFFQRSNSNSNNSDTESLLSTPDYFVDVEHGEVEEHLFSTLDKRDPMVHTDDHNDLSYQYLQSDVRDELPGASSSTIEPSVKSPLYFVEANLPSPQDDSASLLSLRLPKAELNESYFPAPPIPSPSSSTSKQQAAAMAFQSPPSQASNNASVAVDDTSNETSDKSVPPSVSSGSSESPASPSSSLPKSDLVEQNVLVASIKSERNAFRDKCLGLEAEIASLRNTLSSSVDGGSHRLSHRVGGMGMPKLSAGVSFQDPHSTIAALSEKRLTTAGRIYAQSEDGDMENASNKGGASRPRAESVGNAMGGGILKTASSPRIAESFSSQPASAAMRKPSSVMGVGLGDNRCQSRLTKDILRFVASIDSQLEASAQKRQNVLSKVSKAVTALWPRALVKPYGASNPTRKHPNLPTPVKI